jgi:hypothetical protein
LGHNFTDLTAGSEKVRRLYAMTSGNGWFTCGDSGAAVEAVDGVMRLDKLAPCFWPFCGARITMSSSSSTSSAAFRKQANAALRRAAEVKAEAEALAGAKALSTESAGDGKAAYA